MVGRPVACDKSQKRNEAPPIVTRFFKIMFGKDFSKVLYLPPEFARTVMHLADQETQIEDSSGLQWSVTISQVNGSLAFQKGWDKFFQDHGLEKGQFLVFNYIKGSHFVVQIFGKSACEKTNFNNEMPQQIKRSRKEQGTASVNSGDKPASATSVASGSEFQTRPTNLVLENSGFGRTQPLPMSVNMEDPTCMINRDDEYYQGVGEDRNILYDLSSFEMKNRTPDANECHKASNTKLDSSRTETMEDATKSEKVLDTKVSPRHIGTTELAKTMRHDAQMGVVHTYQINGHSGDVVTDKLEKALDAKVSPSQTDIMEHPKTMRDDAEMSATPINQTEGHSGDIFTYKFDKALDTKMAPSHTKITEQTRKKGDDAQMAVINSSQSAGHSGDISTSKFYMKPSDNSTLSKGMLDDVSKFQDGSSKIAEREHAVKSRFRESPAPNSVLKDLFGTHSIKKERVELEDEANGFCQASCRKEPAVVGNHGEIFSPAVKVEPDLSTDDRGPSVAISPFSTEVKSQSYLELPGDLPSIQKGRQRGPGKVVYLRDSIGRLWPVLYPDIFTIKALTGNWTNFCELNNIKPGDECRFIVEDRAQCIYRVSVRHK